MEPHGKLVYFVKYGTFSGSIVTFALSFKLHISTADGIATLDMVMFIRGCECLPYAHLGQNDGF
jgi:hypothetical protein